MRRALSVITVLLVVGLVVLAADASGVWKAQMPGRDGQTREVTFKFKVDGDKLTGTMSGMMGGQDVEIQEGKVAGDTITFKVKREFQGNAMVMLYEGKMAGDEIKFKQTREGSDRPPREFTAKRATS